MRNAAKRVAVLGSGTMGSALVKGLLRANVTADQVVVTAATPEAARSVASELGVGWASTNREAVQGCDLVIVAVKPYLVATVLHEIRDALPTQCTVVSVAAGIRLDELGRHLPSTTAVVRMMPNTPVAVGAGVMVVSCNSACTQDICQLIDHTFVGCGTVVHVPESQQAAATALSGSGPAYVALFTQALIDAGVASGLPRDVATLLASHTVLGTGSLLVEASAHPTLLKEQVTSPGGTTAQGLRALHDGGLNSAVYAAVDAVIARTAELGA